ncbi:alpha/beta fold hydrolase [Hymenobacter sp. ASUV-10]|uniref:Alpha/beta fold hydrolase n=1 Tax=Hymenobacter aranciens TaxID=3063996 RepID=A0ABT9BGE8_9BACT|nr:alpha/beta fold hydrolase [Hymenobacter sp. ASUV-10]MDO7877337.1 alpha/beta fold hydrolase [Hymenobacter sp. ASUV-10]
MNRFLTAGMGLLLLGSRPIQAQDLPPITHTQVIGKQLAYQMSERASRRPGAPIVVFEGGVGAGTENFVPLLPGLSAAGIAWLTYARPGLSGSEPDPDVRTDAEVVARLHALLKRERIAPPYLLVGHSLGGALVRLFAATYPGEVAGLVLIDPTNFMLTAADDERIRRESGSALGYRAVFTTMLRRGATDAAIPAHVRGDLLRAAEANQPDYFGEYQYLPPLPDVPVAVLLAYNSPVEGGEAALSRELQLNEPAWSAQVTKYRIQDFSALIARNHHSVLQLLPGYVHVIHHMDPERVLGVIREVYQHAPAAR